MTRYTIQWGTGSTQRGTVEAAVWRWREEALKSVNAIEDDGLFLDYHTRLHLLGDDEVAEDLAEAGRYDFALPAPYSAVSIVRLEES